MNAATRQLGKHLLESATHTPDGKVRLSPEMLPTAELHNGLARPNDRPPNAIRVHDLSTGKDWRLLKGGRWHRTSD